MNDEVFWTIILILLFNGMLTFAFNVHIVGATETIYIMADGSVYPPTVPILNVGNISYIFVSNINDSIVVERSNIVIDGAGYTLQGAGSDNGTGIDLAGRSNVTVKNTKVIKFYYGIHLESSNNITLSGNTASNNTYGIMLNVSVNNTLVNNHASNNHYDGIYFVYSDSNVLYDNIISSNLRYGIMLSESPDNRIFHNNFVNNTSQVCTYDSWNFWDDDYPSGGNYWSDYEKRYPNATEIDNSGIWNTSYLIDENNRDNYPLMTPWDVNPPFTTDDYDNLWHNTDLTINLKAVDDLTGVAETYYKINKEQIQNITFHGQPRITTENANNTLEYWSIDKAGNEELPHKILTGIKLDKTAPIIGIPSREPASDVQPDQPVKVSVNVTDSLSQVKNVTLYYTLNNGTSWEDPLPMNWSFSTSLYEATIPPKPDDTMVRFKIVAYDYAGNNKSKDGTEPCCIYQVIPEFASAIILQLFMILSIIAVTVVRKRFLRKLQTIAYQIINKTTCQVMRDL